MLIFDRFKTRGDAERFAKDYDGGVYDSQEESNKVDPFPFVLDPPIVLVPRQEWPKGCSESELDEFLRQNTAREDRVEKAVEQYRGRFAGT